MIHRLLVALLVVWTYGTNVSALETQAANQEATDQPGQLFIDPQAVAVVRLDLAKIDVDAVEGALRAELAAITPPPFVQGVWERTIRHLGMRLKRLKDLKVA